MRWIVRRVSDSLALIRKLLKPPPWKKLSVYFFLIFPSLKKKRDSNISLSLRFDDLHEPLFTSTITSLTSGIIVSIYHTLAAIDRIIYFFSCGRYRLNVNDYESRKNPHPLTSSHAPVLIYSLLLLRSTRTFKHNRFAANNNRSMTMIFFFKAVKTD